MSVSRKNILLYEGEGSSAQSVRMAFHTFKYLYENTAFSIQKISPELILEGNCKHYLKGKNLPRFSLRNRHLKRCFLCSLLRNQESTQSPFIHKILLCILEKVRIYLKF